MSFKAKLKVAGKEYNVLSVSYGLFQETALQQLQEEEKQILLQKVQVKLTFLNG